MNFNLAASEDAFANDADAFVIQRIPFPNAIGAAEDVETFFGVEMFVHFFMRSNRQAKRIRSLMTISRGAHCSIGKSPNHCSEMPQSARSIPLDDRLVAIT